MKVIISRKGFDLTSGGVASAIIPDGRLVPFPIPSSGDPSAYADVRVNGVAIGELVEDLTHGKISRIDRCHLDPDIDKGSLPRKPGWQPGFGQDSAFQEHLRKQRVTEGDLFLFFGWYRQVENTPNGWRYARRSPDLHVLYGWLLVGQVIHLDRGERPSPVDAFLQHPHLHYSGTRYDSRNTLYVATDRWQIGNIDAPGAGLFSRLTDNRILTNRSQANRSEWRLPVWMHQTTAPR